MRERFAVIVLLIVAIGLVAPVSATYVLTGDVLTPGQPLVAGAPQQIVANFTLLPTGPANFVRGHELQMQTGLTGAQWNIQVVVDGRDAAQQTASGSTAFISGELLSYPTSHDVALVVAVTGTVPATASGPVNLLLTEEIDNSGAVVPDSAIVISQPVLAATLPTGVTPPAAGQPATPVTAPVATASPAKSPGFELVTGGAAAVTAAMIRSQRHG
ncbi:MAG TPA: hypothetical protein VEI81_02200 [Methanoregula sp.]|nr:hypothetical protein [Methanoregula sp.]